DPSKKAWNNGFLRSDSLFSVVIVTDEDESRTSCRSDAIDPFLRSNECDDEGSAVRNDAYVSMIPEAKASRIELFNYAFRAQRPSRPSLLNMAAVVPKGGCGVTTS